MTTKEKAKPITMPTICPCELGEYRPPNCVDGKRYVWCEIEDNYVECVACVHLKELKNYRAEHPIYRKRDEHGIVTITVQPGAGCIIKIEEE